MSNVQRWFRRTYSHCWGVLDLVSCLKSFIAFICMCLVWVGRLGCHCIQLGMACSLWIEVWSIYFPSWSTKKRRSSSSSSVERLILPTLSWLKKNSFQSTQSSKVQIHSQVLSTFLLLFSSTWFGSKNFVFPLYQYTHMAMASPSLQFGQSN